MRLRPIDVHVVDFFRQRAKTTVDLADLFNHCATYDRSAVEQSLDRLERKAHLVRRISDGRDMIELTSEGRRYVGLAAAESGERIDRTEL
jgi:DNA-binding MarR family transcriptional regulator